MTKLEKFMKQNGDWILSMWEHHEIDNFGYEADSGSLGALRDLIGELNPIKWEDQPTYGDLMTIEDFQRDCDNGSLINYDGVGEFANIDKCANIRVKPRQMRQNRLSVYIKQAIENDVITHVMWFNR